MVDEAPSTARNAGRQFSRARDFDRDGSDGIAGKINPEIGPVFTRSVDAMSQGSRTNRVRVLEKILDRVVKGKHFPSAASADLDMRRSQSHAHRNATLAALIDDAGDQRQVDEQVT